MTRHPRRDLNQRMGSWAMTDDHGEMDLQEFQSLARDWTKWRETFERSDAALRDQQPMARQLPTMRALSRFRPMWELAVSSAAYSILKRPAFLASPKRTDLSMVSDALTTLPGRRALPGFDLMATEVSTLPYGALVRSVPDSRQPCGTTNCSQPRRSSGHSIAWIAIRKGEPPFWRVSGGDEEKS
ncbi:MAG: hypothetical protein IPF71_15020 [Rhodoferax sp.]|nr:hypothetical protein [Rhodoferax sp.]